MSKVREQLLELVKHYGAISDADMQSYMNDTSSLFSRPFIISMRKDDKKYKSASALLLSLGLKPIRFYAMEGKNNTGPIHVDYITNGYAILRPGEKGCLMSHMSVIALAATHPNPEQYTLIFEDDITTSLSGDTLLRHLSNVAPILKREDASILHLGKCLETCTKMEKVDDPNLSIIYRSVAPSCSHARAIKNSFAKRIIADFKDYNKAVDLITGDYIKYREVVGLNFHPGLFYQDVLNYESGLRPRENQIGNYLECSDCCGDKKKLCDEETCGKTKEKFSYNKNFNGEVTAIAPSCSSKTSKMASSMFIWTIFIFIISLAAYYLFTAWSSSSILTISLVVWGIGLLVLATSPSISKGFTSAAEKLGLTPSVFTELNTNTQIEIPPSQPIVHSPHHVYINKSLVEPAYDCFNPNEVRHLSKIYRVARCASRNHSYTILTIIDAESGIVEREMKIDPVIAKQPSKKCQLGIEDMRVFVYQNRIWAIGTCLRAESTPTSCLPGMVLFDLQTYIETGKETVIPIIYQDVMNKPNKNWAPMITPTGELLLVVDFDPLLIVKPSLDTGIAEVYYRATSLDGRPDKKYLTPSPIRNSTITKYIGNSGMVDRYLILLHSKYIGSQGTVYYQHYFGVIDIDTRSNNNVAIYTMLSNCFNVEKPGYPAIEYISGMDIDPLSQTVIVSYGLLDKECKAARISYGKVTSLFRGVDVLS